jgi:hypothetical protein
MSLIEPPADAGQKTPRECVDLLQAKLDEWTLGVFCPATRLCDVLRCANNRHRSPPPPPFAADVSAVRDALAGSGSIKCQNFNELVFALDILEELDICRGQRDDGAGAADSHEDTRKMRQRALPGVDLDYYGIRLLRIKCRFTSPTPGGWADLLINFHFANDPHKHVVEVQLQHAMMLVVRKEGQAHEAYSNFRSAFEILDTLGREPKGQFENQADPDLPALQDLEERMQHLEAENTQLREAVKRLLAQAEGK